MKRKFDNSILLLIYFFISIVICLINKIVGYEIKTYVIIIYYLIVFSTLNYENSIKMVMFLLPMVWMYTGITIYIWIIALISFIIKKRSISLRTVLLIIFFVALEIFSHLLYNNFDFARMSGYLANIVLLLYLLNISKKEKIDYYSCLKCYFYSIFIFFVIYITNTLQVTNGSIMKLISISQFRLGDIGKESNMSIIINANYIAYYSISAFFCGMVLLKNNRTSIKEKRFIYVLEVIILFVGALSISRSYIVTLILTFLIYFLAQFKNKKTAFKAIIIFMAILLIAGIYLATEHGLLNYYLERFQRKDLITANGRTDIMLKYFKIFFSDIRFVLLGTGVIDYTSIMHTQISMHNSIQQIIVLLGIPGALLFFKTLITPVIESKNKQPIVYWLPLIATVIFLQSIQFLNPIHLMLPYIANIFALRSYDGDFLAEKKVI